MGKRLNDIELTPREHDELAFAIEEAFRGHILTPEKFTGTRGLNIYTLLQQDIYTFGGVEISTNTLSQIMTRKHKRPLSAAIYGAVKKYIDAFSKLVKSPEMIGGQRIFWGPNQ